MGAVATERDRGTAAFVLCKTVLRRIHRGKGRGDGAILGLCTAVAVAVAGSTQRSCRSRRRRGLIAPAIARGRGCGVGRADALGSTVTGSTAAADGFGALPSCRSFPRS
jgi:hypothetical protein